MDIKAAKEIFERHNGIMRTKDLIHHRIYSVFVKKLIKEGYVEKIKYGYYQWQDDRSFSEVAVIVRLFPDAVLCMESALQFYGYTDRTPSRWCLAVDKHSTKSRFKIDYPVVKPYYIPKAQLELGVDKAFIEETQIKIFNREHVICDCLRHENKMDVEIFNKAIQAYIKDPKKNIPRILDYAKILRTETKMRKTIGVWL